MDERICLNLMAFVSGTFFRGPAADQDAGGGDAAALRAAGRAVRLGGLGRADGAALWAAHDPAPARSAEKRDRKWFLTRDVALFRSKSACCNLPWLSVI